MLDQTISLRILYLFWENMDTLHLPRDFLSSVWVLVTISNNELSGTATQLTEEDV
jgi:hypothetical protein